jgi:glucose-1-phosphate adenylyltransferase
MISAKNIIPNMLADQQRMVAYPLRATEGRGHHRQPVGSQYGPVDPNVPLDVWDPEWKIYSRTSGRPGHYIGTGALVDNAMLTEGCSVEGTVANSVLFAGARVEKDAMVESTILMPGAVVEEGAEVYYSIIAENVTIKKRAVVGARPENVEDKSKWGVALWAKVSPSVKTPRWGRRRCWKKTYRTVRIYGKHQRAGDHFPQYL